MTAPRQVLPGATYHLTRRCSQRQFLLRPSKSTNDIFTYVLAVAARRFGIAVHVGCVMSNHAHLLVTDPTAQLPRFQQFLNAQVARAMNASLGRWESFWAPDTYSATRLMSTGDIVSKAAYVLANPVAAGLVRHGRDWPGLWTDPEHFGRVIEIRRPEHFFAEDGDMPEKISLEVTAPPGFASVDDFRDRVVKAFRRAECDARERVQNRFIGRARVLAQKPTSRPATLEPRRRLNPHIAAKNMWMRIEALADRVAFVRRYREALAKRRAGNLDAVFPAGTYQMRVMHDVPCAGFS